MIITQPGFFSKKISKWWVKMSKWNLDREKGIHFVNELCKVANSITPVFFSPNKCALQPGKELLHIMVKVKISLHYYAPWE